MGGVEANISAGVRITSEPSSRSSQAVPAGAAIHHGIDAATGQRMEHARRTFLMCKERADPEEP
jgi:hypothetical protein